MAGQDEMTGETKVNFALCVCRVVLYAGLSVAGAMSARLAQRASAAMRALSLSLTVRLKKGRRDRRRDERRQIYCWSRDHSETPTFGLCDVIASVLILAMHGEFFFCCCQLLQEVSCADDALQKSLGSCHALAAVQGARACVHS